MKLTQVERISLIVTGLALFAMIGFFLGSGGAGTAAAQHITADRSLAQSPSPSAALSPDSPSPSAVLSPSSPSPSEEITLLININTATVQQLQTLPGIGAAKAQAIVDYREEHGPFRYVEDLRSVRGIGETILKSVMDYITVG